jgi:drug/metabolite transporter (DMT)-like permease
MSFQQKNIAVSLGSFILIMGFFLFRVAQMIQGESFNPPTVFRLWGITIVLAIVVTIFATILTHIISAIIQAIVTGEEDPKIEDIEDERDRIIDLRGTKVTYIVFSIGVLLAMLTFVFGQPPLVMFTMLIFAGIFAQIIGDILRLYLYRRGF